MHTSEIIIKYVCPSLGTIMASLMFASPITSLKIALSKGSLGDLNPVPWAFMTGNCLGWVAYAFVTRNIFVLVSNLPGLILSVWLNLGAAKIHYMESHSRLRDFESLHSENRSNNNNDEEEDDLDSDNHDNDNHLTDNIISNSQGKTLPSSSHHEKLFILILLLWSGILSIVVFVPMSNEREALVTGTSVNLNLVVFYGAPLSTIVKVFKTRSSRSIHRRTLAMGLLNSFFWLVYGTALWDMVIFIPNFCGFLLSVLQLILCLIFSSKEDHDMQLSEQLVEGTSFTNNDESVIRNNHSLELL